MQGPGSKSDPRASPGCVAKSRSTQHIGHPLKPIDRPTHSFSYEYTCDGHPHRHQIDDWEVQAAFMHYKRWYKTEAKALEMMTQEYQHNIPTRNLHFIVGTMKAHPQTFILIGLLRTGLNPQELDKQGELF